MVELETIYTKDCLIMFYVKLVKQKKQHCIVFLNPNYHHMTQTKIPVVKIVDKPYHLSCFFYRR